MPSSKLACLVLSSARSCRSRLCPSRLSADWRVSLLLIMPVTFVLSRTQLVMLSCMWCSAHFSVRPEVSHLASLRCACLVSSMFLSPNGIAGSMHELYTCIFTCMGHFAFYCSRGLLYIKDLPSSVSDYLLRLRHSPCGKISRRQSIRPYCKLILIFWSSEADGI